MSYEVIAIGASWGGLSAVGTLLEGIPEELDQAIVVAQHRSAESSRGVLESLLQRHSTRPVREPGDKEPIEASHVYVAPADYHLLVDDGHFALSVDARVQFARPSIDVLFESVARRVPRPRDRDRAHRCERRRGHGARRDQAERRRLDRAGPEDRGAAHDAGRRDRRLGRRRGTAARADPRLPLRAVLPVSETARAKLLLVDDRPENLLALEAILEPLDTDLVRASSGEEALRQLLSEEYAAILLDVQMPGLDGFQTAELIKRRERTKHVPILFLTAISKDAEHIFRGYSAGAVDYLMKPFDPLILRSKVAVFIELWQKTVEIRRRDALLAEQELAAAERESELRYRSLADAVPQIVWTTDAEGRTRFYNERWFEYTGMSRETPASAFDAIHPEDVAG